MEAGVGGRGGRQAGDLDVDVEVEVEVEVEDD
jgi:hypothetical protein